MSPETGPAALTYPDKLTSAVYGVENPPRDWADCSLLIPHEMLRHEMKAMMASVEALEEYSSQADAWKALYFAEWYVESFYPLVHLHHDNEEDLYFPWLQTKAEIPQKSLSEGHNELIARMDEIKNVCNTIVGKKGIMCGAETKELQELMPALCKFTMGESE